MKKIQKKSIYNEVLNDLYKIPLICIKPFLDFLS
jgi:hypothetical protein